MLLNLENRIVFVTGSARRVGKAIVLGFAQAGANVVVHHRGSPDEADETAQAARELGVDALVIQGDHGNPDDIQRNFAAIQAHFGRLDVLVNSAGLFPSNDLLDIALDEWQQVVDVNISAPFLCTQYAGRIMRDQKIPGVIINIADNSGRRPWAARPHHSISKAAVIMLTEVTAKALAPYQIRANCIVPGPVMPSPGMSVEKWRSVEQRLPLKRSGDGDDVARAAVFLAANDFITGAVLSVDGGEYIGQDSA